MDNKELKKAFKKVKDVFFLLSDASIVCGWGSDDGIPRGKIFIGRRGAPRPELVLTPYDIDRVECTKPGLFKAGILTVVGTGGTSLFSAPFKDKSNLKAAEKFNECLKLYKSYNLGK